MASEYALLEVGVTFAAIAVVGAIARRIGQSVIPFYILAGMGLGPAVLGRVSAGPWESVPHVTETEFVSLGAELGIVFLLFFLGLEFNLGRLLANRGAIGRAGIVDLAINFGAGLVVGYALFRDPLAAYFVAGIVYISSSAIITKSLIDNGWIANPEAGPMLGTLVFEDLFIAVYLAIGAALVLGGGGPIDAAVSIGVALGFVLVLLVGVYLGTAALERALDTGSNEARILRVVGITVLVSGVALAVGVSEAVAAFFVGMAFSEVDDVEVTERLLEPIRDVFAAVFFFWIGLITDPLAFVGVGGAVAVAVLTTTPTKLVSGYLGGRIYGLNGRRATRVGLGMVTRGEFSLIIAALALQGAGVGIDAGVAASINALAVGYVLVMSLLGTSLMQYADGIATLQSRLTPTRTEL